MVQSMSKEKPANSNSIPPIPRLKNEPLKWYSRFVSYCLLGTQRSLSRVFNDERHIKALKGTKKQPSGSWKVASKKYNWVARAARYDKAVLLQAQKEVEEIRQQEQRKRLDLLVLARQKLETIINSLDPKLASWAAVAGLLRAIFDISHSELEAINLEKRLQAIEDTQNGTNTSNSIAANIVRLIYEQSK